jgi:hypothetical protein
MTSAAGGYGKSIELAQPVASEKGGAREKEFFVIPNAPARRTLLFPLNGRSVVLLAAEHGFNTIHNLSCVAFR